MERALTAAEMALIEAIIDGSTFSEGLGDLSGMSVTEMSDGGMGSLEFAGEAERRMGGSLGAVEFQDADGVPVIASLLLDEQGRLFQLDLWKVDFSRLIEIPGPERFRPAT